MILNRCRSKKPRIGAATRLVRSGSVATRASTPVNFLSDQVGGGGAGSARRGPRHIKLLAAQLSLIASIGIVTALLIAVPIVVLTSALQGETKRQVATHRGSYQEPPVWAKGCFSSLAGPVNHEYDGLRAAEAQRKAERLGQALLLVANDGRCVHHTLPFIPHQVGVALSNGRVILARGQ